MKVKILGKYISKSGSGSILVATTNKDDANNIAINATTKGASKEQVTKLITSKDFKGEMSYSFFMYCSKFTFEKIDPFGILDCEVECLISEKGLLYAKIPVIDKKEQINGYEAPDSQEEEVDGWNVAAPEPKIVAKQEVDMTQVHEPAFKEVFNPLSEQPGDLPF
jgi:hypothetical protein